MFKRGQLVMLVGSDGFMPPFGSVGEVLAFDGEDYDVEFPGYPCPNPPGTFWCAPPSWLMPIEPPAVNAESGRRELCPTHPKD